MRDRQDAAAAAFPGPHRATQVNMRIPVQWLVPGFLALLVGCGGEDLSHAAEGQDGPLAQAPKTVLITGSSTLGPLIAAAAERYEKEHPEVRIDVQTGGSSRGIADARRGLAEIGMTSRGLAPSERAGLREHIIARDGVGFVVHTDNPVSSLTGSQLLDIFTGIKTDWLDVGGDAGEIVVINRPAGRSELSLVAGYFRIPPGRMVAAAIGGENTQVIKLVAGNPRAISYVSIGSAAHSITSGSQAKLLELGDIPATPAHVREGTYALPRPLVLVTGPKVSPAAQAFLDELLSDRIDDLILAHSFAPPQRDPR